MLKKKGANTGHSHFYETFSMIQDTTVFKIFRSELWFLQKIYCSKISHPVTPRLNYLDLFQQKWPFCAYLYSISLLLLLRVDERVIPQRGACGDRSPWDCQSHVLSRNPWLTIKYLVRLMKGITYFQEKKKCWLQKM